MGSVETPRQRVTRAEVARLAGVSTAVVSYVVNDGPKTVAPATRAKVLAAIDALGYRPNTAARALSKGTADMIGMVVSDARNPFFAELIYAIDHRARTRGDSTLVVSTETSSRTVAQHLADLASQRVRGIVCFHAVDATTRDRIARLGLPVVLVNQSEPADGLRSVRIDYRGGAEAAVAHLIGHGSRDIAFVGADEGVRAREQGWADALAAADLAARRPYLTAFSLQGGYQAGQLIAAESHRPDAVFIASDQMAMGVLSAFYDAGIEVPSEIAVASFDGTMESAYLCPPLTTVRQPMEQIAEATIAALTDADGVDSDQVIATELVIRRSCGC